MTPEQREELKTAAQAADHDGQHIYTNPRDSNNWRKNDAFNAMASPAVVLSLIAQVEAQATEREKLLNIIASAYQIAGKHDAPARVLDVLADPLAATEEQVEAMLPYQVEALTVPQWHTIETAPQDGYMLVHEDDAIRAKFRYKGEWQHIAYPAIIGQWGDVIVGEDAKRLLPAGCRLEMRDGCCENPTHWMPLPAAPTIPAIPGTKEGA